MARALLEAIVQSNVDRVLAVVSVSTLVVHRRGNEYVTTEYGRRVAARIPGARFVDVAGRDHVVYAGDQEPVLGEIEEFLTGVRHTPDVDRVLATVLFTDLVASTETASRMGDQRWRELLDRHDELIRRQLDAHRGRLTKTTGDGIVATFDGPARAIRCAQTLNVAMEELGLQTRSGLHTGEIELRGDDIAGIAVHIAARVEAAAGSGEILVSGSVPPLVAGSGICFEDRGEHDLKGVPDRWRLLAVVPAR